MAARKHSNDDFTVALAKVVDDLIARYRKREKGQIKIQGKVKYQEGEFGGKPKLVLAQALEEQKPKLMERWQVILTEKDHEYYWALKRREADGTSRPEVSKSGVSKGKTEASKSKKPRKESKHGHH